MIERPTDLIAGLQKPTIQPFLIAELDYPSGMVRLCSLDRPISVGGHEYAGISVLGKVSAIESGIENRSFGARLELSGIPGSFAQYIASQDVQGRRVRIGFGAVNESMAVLGVHFIFGGLMDTQEMTTGNPLSVAVNCETENFDWARTRGTLCTDADQQANYAGDLFFEYSAAMENATLLWGRA